MLAKLGSFLARAWFPAALVFLLLLSVPGIVFFVLSLTPLRDPANLWLQENFSLTFHIPFEHHPWAVILLLLLPFLILLLYFLKLKRRPLQVPSTFLWKKSIEDLHVNSLFQWLRRNVLLLLQLLFVLFLIYTVMGFRVYGNMAKGKNYILMIDNSASMSTRDMDGKSRLEWAIEEAVKEIDAATDNDIGMLIVFNSDATTLVANTKNRAELRKAVLDIKPTNKSTDILDALKLADGRANPRQSTENMAIRPELETPENQVDRQYVDPKGEETQVYLFSDGRFPALSDAVLANFNSRQLGNTSALGNLKMHFRAAGKQGSENVNNVGIVTFNAVRLPDKSGRFTDPDKMDLQVFLIVHNYRPQAVAEGTLYLDVLVNGQRTPGDQQGLNVPARVVKANEHGVMEDNPGQQRIKIDLKGLDLNANIVLHASFKEHKDDYALDDQAWLTIVRTRKTRVLFVGPENRIFEAFFKAHDKIADVEKISASDMEGETYRKAVSGDYDMVIFDRCTPSKLDMMPRAHTLFLDQVPPPWEKGKKEVKTPTFIVTEQNHPFLRRIFSLRNVTVSKIFHFDPAENLPEAVRGEFTTDIADKSKKLLPPMTALVETENDVPVIFLMQRGPFQDVVLPFAIQDDKGGLETWALEPSFFLFLKNVFYDLGKVKDAVQGETVAPGHELHFQPGATVRALSVFPPDGGEETLKRDEGVDFVFSGTDQVGIYKAVTQDQSGTVEYRTVSLLDPEESNIEPRLAFQVGSEQVISEQERQQVFEIWKWVLLGALILLLVEWYIYNRRVYI